MEYYDQGLQLFSPGGLYHGALFGELVRKLNDIKVYTKYQSWIPVDSLSFWYHEMSSCMKETGYISIKSSRRKDKVWFTSHCLNDVL